MTSRTIELSKTLAILWILSLSLFLTVTTAKHASAAANPKYASLVMDADTGLILYQSHADKQLHPASLTKMMTLLLTFEAIKQGKLSTHDKVYISNHAASQVPSKLDLPAGSYIRVEDAIYSLVTKSANDVAVALAEKLGGTESNFALKMTYKAKSIGMNNTRFYNASGLHHPKQVSSARDMAILARHIINEYPDEYRYFSTRHFTYHGNTYRNHNRMLGVYKGMDGMKTGYIQASGFNLVASAKRNDRRIIGVVFGGRSSQSRNAHMKTILDRGFNKIDSMMIASQNAPRPGRKPEFITLASIEPAAGHAQSALASNGNKHYEVRDGVKWADFNPLLEDQAFRTIIGEGDFDPSEIKRFKAGLSAISALKKYTEKQRSNTTGEWAIQIGAFKSREKTEDIIYTAMHILPPDLARSTSSLAPIKTRSGTMYRARLLGYSKQDAEQACSHFSDCLAVAPNL